MCLKLNKWFSFIGNMLVCRHLPALGESLATLVGAMPVAFLETDLNAHNPLSVFNTKTPRERASESPSHYCSFVFPCSNNAVNTDTDCFLTKTDGVCSLVLSMPDTVEEMCPEMPRLDRLLTDVSDVSESGARYSDMPQVRLCWWMFECLQTASSIRHICKEYMLWIQFLVFSDLNRTPLGFIIPLRTLGTKHIDQFLIASSTVKPQLVSCR